MNYCTNAGINAMIYTTIQLLAYNLLYITITIVYKYTCNKFTITISNNIYNNIYIYIYYSMCMCMYVHIVEYMNN